MSRFQGFPRSSALQLALLGSILLGGIALTAQNGPDDSGNSFGLVASKDVSAKDVGLPLYPGAKLAQKDKNGDPSAQIGLWAGDTGFKLVILKLESADSADKISNFYRGALAKYGKVLDCTSSKSADTSKHDTKARELTCEDDHDSDGIVLKSGTKDKQHIVGIETKGDKRLIQLIYLIDQERDNRI